MKNWISTLLLLLTAALAHATHIVGGSITYQYQGNDQYLVKVEVFRDCYNGVPYFDNPIAVGVFDEDNALVGELAIPLDLISIDTVSVLPGNFVCVFPQGVCIEKAVYSAELILPSAIGKYTLAYQRCCRSQIISNLQSPLDIGMTFTTVIDNSMVNTSPVFNQDIPVAIFNNVPFIYDGGATDPDGDSLVYSLTAPFVGANQIMPQPQPPSPPPYTQAVFVDPPYSVGNMLGGNYPLAINVATGEFSAIPTINGAFQIAYKVDEYRNGQLIGTTYREFLFVVIPPEPTVNYDVSGKVMIDSLTPLDAGTVQLLQRDVTTDSLHLYGTYTVLNGGDYSFLDIPPGVFYLRAMPDSASAFFGSYLPTYYRNNLFWYDALTVNQCDTSQFYRDIYLINVDSFASGGGTQQLRGTVRNFVDNKVVPYLDLLLGDPSGAFFKHTTTNQYGRFTFSGLPEGEYWVYADLWNSAILNIEPPLVPLVAGQDEFATLLMYSDKLEFIGFTSTNEKKEVRAVSILPNPANSKALLRLTDDGFITKITVSDCHGRLVMEQSYKTIGQQTSASLETASLPDGYYVVRYVAENGWGVVKLLVKH